MSRLGFSWVIDGKLAGHSKPSTAEDLQFLHAQGVRALVRLVMDCDNGYFSRQIKEAGLEDLNVPMVDFQAPELEAIKQIVEFIDDRLDEGKPVSVSCFAGIGRTGTVLACYLVHTGLTAKQALDKVRARRGTYPETQSQLDAVHEFENRLS